MKFVVLMENTAPEGACLSAEAGLSLYIEHRGHKLLLDAGSSGKFADNAAALKLPKKELDGVLRISFSYDTTLEDVQALAEGLKAAQEQLFTSLS